MEINKQQNSLGTTEALFNVESLTDAEVREIFNAETIEAPLSEPASGAQDLNTQFSVERVLDENPGLRWLLDRYPALKEKLADPDNYDKEGRLPAEVLKDAANTVLDDMARENPQLACALERLPSLRDELTNPRNYDRHGNLKVNIEPIYSHINNRNEIRNNRYRSALEGNIRQFNSDNERHKSSSSAAHERQTSNDEADFREFEIMSKVRENLKKEMVYEWYWDNEAQQRVRVLVPKSS
jgi:hypothetical protein